MEERVRQPRLNWNRQRSRNRSSMESWKPQKKRVYSTGKKELVVFRQEKGRG